MADDIRISISAPPEAARAGLASVRDAFQETVREFEAGGGRGRRAAGELLNDAPIRRHATAQRELRQRVRETRGEMRGLVGEVRALGPVVAGAFSAAAVVAWGRAVIQAGIQTERWQRALTVATGSQQAATRELAFARAEADRLGLSVGPVIDGYAGIAAAARGTVLQGEEARQVFLGVLEATSALGKSADDTAGILRAVEQIMSKGTVQAEELRGQLGERLPGAFELAARSMGVTTEALNEMLARGEVAASDFLPRFAKLLRDEFGQQAAEGANSAGAAIARLGNAVDDLAASFAQSGALESFAVVVGVLTDIVRLSKIAVLGLRLLGGAAAIPGAVLDNLREGRENPVDDALAAFADFRRAEYERLRLVQNTNAQIGASEEEIASKRTALLARREAEVEKLTAAETALAEESKRVRIEADREQLSAKERTVRESLALVRQELQQALEAERRYTEQIKELRQQQADQQRSIDDQIRELRRRGMTEAEQQADLEQQIATKLNDAREALEQGGDANAARTLANEARSLIGGVQDNQRAEALLVGIGQALEQASAAEIGAAEKARQAERKRFEELSQLAAGGERVLAGVAGELARLASELDALTEKPRVLKLQTNVDEVLSKVKQIDEALAKLGGAAGASVPPAAPGFRTGGHIPGFGGGDRVPAYLERGEFVVRKEAVRRFGPELFAALNASRLPRRAPGVLQAVAGATGGVQRFAQGGPVLAAGSGPRDIVEHIVRFDNGGQHRIFAERDGMRELLDILAEGRRGR